MILDGMSSVPEANVQRICASTLQLLCKEWLNPQSKLPEQIRRAFLAYSFERITPASFQATAQPHFDHRDASCATLLVSICALHRTLFEQCGEDWIKYLSNVFFPSVNCPKNVSDEYCKVVMESKNAKEIRGAFKRLFLENGNNRNRS